MRASALAYFLLRCLHVAILSVTVWHETMVVLDIQYVCFCCFTAGPLYHVYKISFAVRIMHQFVVFCEDKVQCGLPDHIDNQCQAVVAVIDLVSHQISYQYSRVEHIDKIAKHNGRKKRRTQVYIILWETAKT